MQLRTERSRRNPRQHIGSLPDSLPCVTFYHVENTRHMVKCKYRELVSSRGFRSRRDLAYTGCSEEWTSADRGILSEPKEPVASKVTTEEAGGTCPTACSRFALRLRDAGEGARGAMCCPAASGSGWVPASARRPLAGLTESEDSEGSYRMGLDLLCKKPFCLVRQARIHVRRWSRTDIAFCSDVYSGALTRPFPASRDRKIVAAEPAASWPSISMASFYVSVHRRFGGHDPRRGPRYRFRISGGMAASRPDIR